MISFLKKAILQSLLFIIVTVSSSYSEDVNFSNEAYEWLKSYVNINTVNPPGNEIKAVNFFKNIFEKEGIEYKIYKSSKNRANILAEIKGGTKPSIMLLQHMDTVDANKKFWITNPFKATEKLGYLYGRGTLDMKGTGISHLATFVRLNRQKEKLNRNIIFLATADEETGGRMGLGWLINNHPNIFKNVWFVLTEGGSGRIINQKLVFEIEVTQKVPVWLKLTSFGNPGHASSPQVSSSITKLIDALNYLKENHFPPRVISSVEDYFYVLSDIVDTSDSKNFKNIKKVVSKKDFINKLQKKSPFHHSLTRDTCSITRLGGSNKINVVPAEAWAEIDCRILPDKNADDFIKEIKEILSTFDIKVEKILAFNSSKSSIDTKLYKTIYATLKKDYPAAYILPRVTTGFTDSHYIRPLGIQSYGFNPVILDLQELKGIHGNNERISIKAFKKSVIDQYNIIKNFVY